MSEATAVLFGIEDEFDVMDVARTGPGQVTMIIEMRSEEVACPTCGVMSARIRDRPLRRIKDLPACGQPVQLWWRKRRLVCAEVLCPRRTFTQTSEAIRPRARVSERLRNKIAHAIAVGNRAVSEVAEEYQVSWPTAHKALVAAAAKWLPSRPRRHDWASMRPGSGRVRWDGTSAPTDGPTASSSVTRSRTCDPRQPSTTPAHSPTN